MFKLGTIVTDKASGLKGALLCMQCEGAGVRWYQFQPAGLTPEDKTPIERAWLTEDRIEGERTNDPDLPIHAIGTEAEDTITGYKGTVVNVTLYHTGCVHIGILPKGSHPKTGKMMPPHEFDLRLVKGKAFKQYTESERKESQASRPSPPSVGFAGPIGR